MNKMIGAVGDGADKVVGDVILGGVGRIGYHLGDVPVVGHAGRYVRDNVRDGYKAEKVRCQKKVAARCIAALLARKDEPTSDEIRQFCIDSGIAPEHLDNVAAKAEDAVKGKVKAMKAAQEEMDAPETRRPASPTPAPAPDVPLPTGARTGLASA